MMDKLKKLQEYCTPLSVLYVEDEKQLRDSVIRYLEKFFKEIDTAENGQEGLDKYRSYSYDIVITDIKMPKLNGLEMSEEIKKINPEQEIIVISAHTENDFFLHSIKLGITDYIVKPIDYHQMNDVLYRVANILNVKAENKAYHENLISLVKEQTQLIETNYEDTLIAMVDMIESRDSYTGGHSQRVANYSKLIAVEMGLPENECNLVYRAAMLHDIGKVTTPDTILLKPGKLSKNEYQMIQQHVVESYNLLSKIPMYNELAKIVASHHEHYDGSGYPEGLKGNEIPFLSRIMIIADSFDAMTTNRIYKGRKTLKKALEEIRKDSGTHFDPTITPYAEKALQKTVIEHHVSQLPETKMEKERFAYFFRDNITNTYNKNYLSFCLQNTSEDFHAYIFFMHNLSQYNKKFNWEEGDKLLQSVANLLISRYPNSQIFRIHGDDFVVLNKEILPEDFNFLNEVTFLKDTGVTLSNYKIPDDKDIFEYIEQTA